MCVLEPKGCHVHPINFAAEAKVILLGFAHSDVIWVEREANVDAHSPARWSLPNSFSSSLCKSYPLGYPAPC